MIGFFRNPRRVLIVVHDLVVTALAVLVTLYIRFADGQNGGLTVRYHWLVVILPGYVVYAGIVYWYFNLYIGKWRFASLQDLSNIIRAVTVLAVSLLVLDYILLYPTLFGTYFFGKVTIALYWLLQIFFLGGPRISYRLFKHSRAQQKVQHSNAVPTLLIGHAAETDVLIRAVESGAVKNVRPVGILSPSPADQGSAVRRVRRARPPRRSRKNRRRVGCARHTRWPGGVGAERIGAGTASGNDADAGAPARSGDQPDAVARRRRGGAASGAGQCRGFVAAAEREDRLRAAGELHQGQDRRGHRRRRLDRRRNLRSGRQFPCRPASRHREFRAGIARRARTARRQIEHDDGRGPDCRRPRPRADVPIDRRVQAEPGFSCRRAQARAASGTRLGRRHQDQRLRFGQCRRCRAQCRRRCHGDDLDRQGDRPGFRARRHQAPCRNVLPGAGRGGQCRPQQWRQAADAHDRGALRQRARLQRLGGAEIQGADRGRRPGHRDPSGHGALFHDHPRSLRSGRSRRQAMRSVRRARTRRSMCSIWASRSKSSISPNA